MKRSLKASGLLSALSLSLFGVSVVGCSAEGTPDSEALGTTSQAQGTFTPTGTNVPADLQFSGEFKLTASSILVIGGYNAAGNGQVSAGIITNTSNGNGNWVKLTNQLPTALGEVEITPLNNNSPVSKFLVAGGRATRDGAATASAWILALSGGPPMTTATWTRVDMSQARVIGKNNLQRCGNLSHYIAIGGITNNGMTSTGAPSVTDKIEVFHYVAGGASSWGPLQLASNSKTVYLPAGRGYHEVLHVSDTNLRVAGGATASASAIVSVGKVQVNSTCQADDASVVDKTVASPVITTGTSLPSARARMSSIKSSGTLDLGGGSTFSYDFVIATGNDTNRFSTTPPTAIFFYNSAGNGTFNGTFASLTSGRVFGRLVQDDTTSTSVRMGTGVVPGVLSGTNTFLYDTPTTVNLITNAGAVSSPTGFTNGRVGSAVQLFGLANAADYAALGTKYTTGTAAAQADVVDF
jgi:hypothetical protein